MIKTEDPDFRLMQDELFGPVVTAYVYDEKRWDDTLRLVDETGTYALTGAVFAGERSAIGEAHDALRYAAGNFYVNDKPTGAVVGQQPFGGARASGTNDKAGSLWNLIRWVSPRTVKETLVPATDYRYPSSSLTGCRAGTAEASVNCRSVSAEAEVDDADHALAIHASRSCDARRDPDPTESFWSFLSDIAIVPLLAAIGCHLLKLACTSRAWRNVLAAAYPERPWRWRPILAAYVSGVGINAIVPARAGDAVRIFLAHRAIPGSSYTTIVSSTVVLTFVDMALALLVFGWALTQGVLPSFDALSALPAFDYSWAFEDGVIHPAALLVILGVLAGGAWLLHHFWHRLRRPRRAGLRRLRPADALRPYGRRLAARGLDAPARRPSGSSSAPSASRRASATSSSSRRR